MKKLTPAIRRVLEAADRLTQQDIAPTYERLREELGGVSYNTISMGLKAWRARRESERQRVEDCLRYRLELEQAIAEISTRFVPSVAGEFDELIDWTLARIGKMTGAHRSYLFRLADGGDSFGSAHEWCVEGIAPQIDSIRRKPAADFAPVFALLRRAEVLQVRHPADQGVELEPLQRFMEETGARSLVNVPVSCDGSLQGVLGFAAVGVEKVWPEEVVRLLRTVADILGRALVHGETERQLRESARYLGSLDRVSRILTGSRDSADLMSRLTETLLDLFRADRAFLAHPLDVDAVSIRVPVETCRPEYPGANATDADIPVIAESRELFRRILDSDDPVAVDFTTTREPSETAQRFRIKSMLAIAIRPRHSVPWLLGLHQCACARHWSDEERRLFRSVAERVSETLTGHLLFERLRHSEARLLEAQSIAHLGNWERDFEADTLIWSDETLRIFAWPVGAPPSYEKFMALVHHADRERLRRAQVDAMSGCAPLDVEYRIVRPDGQVRYLYERGEASFDANGRLRRLAGVVQDITQQKRIEAKLQEATAEWNHAMDFYDDAIYLLDLDRRVVRANQAFYRLTRTSETKVIGRHIAEILHPQGEASPCPVCRVQEERRDAVITMESDHADNPTGMPIEAICRVIRDSQGAPSGILMTIRDLTRIRQTEEKLRLSATVFESTSEGVMITDRNASIVAVNPAFTEITGYTEEEVLGKNPSVLRSQRQDRALYQSMWASIQETGSWRGEVWNRRKNGNIYPEWLNVSSVTDDSGEVVNYVGLFSDITQIKLSQEKLDHLAHHDPLTDLPNRLLFRARLEHAMDRAGRNDSIVAVLFLDLDRFKHVNDSLGHTLGDALLQAVAARFVDVVRREDTVARMGGDEFTVLLEGLREGDEAALLAEKLIGVLSAPFQIEDQELYVSASIGISIYPRDGERVETLLKNADAAMYRAKDEGRSTYRFYAREMTTLAFERVLLEGQLRRAIEQKELMLHYQPQVDMRTGRLVGIEALVRWEHPELGLVWPARFIPIAEESGLIMPLGEWVLHHACAQAQRWLDDGIELQRMAVNIAGPQIERGYLIDTIGRVLQETGLAPQRLELEITESFVMDGAEVAAGLLDALRNLGVGLAIDDFGTGYSSLSYLKRLPVDKLKIDRSFVRDLPGDEHDAAIARAVIALGHSMQFTVVAEGVESEQQRDFLLIEGCDQAQGYFFGRPVAAEELEALVFSGDIRAGCENGFKNRRFNNSG